MTERKYYEAYDDRYQQVHAQSLQWFSDTPSEIIGEVMQAFSVTPDRRILEIGCGEGRDAAPILEKGYNLLATDISPEAISYCCRKFPKYASSFRVLDCVSGRLEEKFDFIYAVAVIHMLVEERDRAAFYRFIRSHLTDEGIALICTMGDGSTERKSDISTAFSLQERTHEQTGRTVSIAGTSCRMVNWDTFHAELSENGLDVIQDGMTSIPSVFPEMMYAVVRRKPEMPVIAGLGWTFDTAAETYEKMRPGYVQELYRTVFDYVPIDSNCKTVEIGIGGGQATLPVLERGCELTAVERGEQFSALCAEKFRDYPGFRVVTGKFEEVPFEQDAYDLVFSASAFHWIPEEVGYRKVLSMLKPGGAFARFANHPYPDKGKPELMEEIEKLYGAYYCKFHNREKSVPMEYTLEQAKERAMIAQKYGFTDIRYALYKRTRTFTAREYIALLGTYSDHIVMEDALRIPFFEKIEEAINDYGGTFTLYDTIDLQLARKP